MQLPLSPTTPLFHLPSADSKNRIFTQSNTHKTIKRGRNPDFAHQQNEPNVFSENKTFSKKKGPNYCSLSQFDIHPGIHAVGRLGPLDSEGIYGSSPDGMTLESHLVTARETCVGCVHRLPPRRSRASL